MQQVPVPRVVDGEQQPQDPLLVAGVAVDVVSERRRVLRAVAGLDGRPVGEGGVGGAEAGDCGEKEEKRDEQGGEECE